VTEAIDESPKVDPTVSHSARIWNYWLGGKDNFQVDREIGDQFRGLFPDIVDIARGSRAFLTRAVTFLAGEAGIRQFLDIGTGLPTVNNTHEVAQRVAPESRIVYVDNDPMVLAHARALAGGHGQRAPPNTSTQLARAGEDPGRRQPAPHSTSASRSADADEHPRPCARPGGGPVGRRPADGRAALRQLPGDSRRDQCRAWRRVRAGHRGVERQRLASVHLRSTEQISTLLDGLEVLEPGLVSCPYWRPDPADADSLREVDEFGAVARKP